MRIVVIPAAPEQVVQDGAAGRNVPARMCDDLSMTDRRHRGVAACAVATIIGAALAWAAPAPADPADPVLPVTTVPVPPPVDPAAAAPPANPFQPYVPPIQNPQYGSGKYGGGILGTFRDLWDQARNPTLDSGPDSARPVPPPGAGPAPALPPGYVSINAPGSETASSTPAGGPATGRPALPPGYYSLNGPPPPGYEYGTPVAIPTTTVPPTLKMP